MDRRLELQTLLESILGVRRVYFVPPSNLQMQYPAFVYNLDDIDTEFASNRPYRQTKRYQVTYIDPNADSSIVDHVAALPMCSFSRHYTADNLNHYVFSIYF